MPGLSLNGSRHCAETNAIFASLPLPLKVPETLGLVAELVGPGFWAAAVRASRTMPHRAKANNPKLKRKRFMTIRRLGHSIRGHVASHCRLALDTAQRPGWGRYGVSRFGG